MKSEWSIRPLIDTWTAWVIREGQEDRVHTLLDGNGLLMFFKKDGDYFGAPEESRLTFAKMKNPEGDRMDDASFVAINLTRTVMGEPTKVIINKKDLKKIKIVKREDAEKKLLAKVRGRKDEPVKSGRTSMKQKDHGFTMIRDEE